MNHIHEFPLRSEVNLIQRIRLEQGVSLKELPFIATGENLHSPWSFNSLVFEVFKITNHIFVSSAKLGVKSVARFFICTHKLRYHMHRYLLTI